MRFKQPIGELPNVVAHVRNMELINPFKDIPENAKFVIKRGRVIDPLSKTDKIMGLAIQGGKISSVRESIEVARGDATIDAEGLMVVPGLFDIHLHLYDILTYDKKRNWCQATVIRY